MDGAGDEYFHLSGMTFEQKGKINERAAVDPNSQLYAAIRNRFLSKLSAIKEARDKKSATGNRKRFVVPYTLESDEVFELTKSFSQFDLQFKHNERVDASYYKALLHIMHETLFSRLKGNWSKVIAYGLSLNSLVIHNRNWVHLCIPNADVTTAVSTVRDDRAMCMILNSSLKKSQPLPMLRKYSKGELQDLACTDPVSCVAQGKIGIMSLHATDTNFRQLCVWMNKHGLSQMYFIIPACKAMEHCYDSEFPELQARVVANGDKSVTLCFRNAMTSGQTYTMTNYLTLLAQTQIIMKGKSYYKEFLDWHCGFATYKITASDKAVAVDDHVYRTWMTPSYKDYYLITSYELKDQTSDIFDRRSYREVRFAAKCYPVDKLVEYTMSMESQSVTPDAIMRRLRSVKLTSVTEGYHLTSTDIELDEKQCTHVTTLVYTYCYMTKYVTGVSLSMLVGQDKELQFIRKSGVVSLVPYMILMLLQNNFTLTFSKLAGYIRRLYVKYFQRDTVQLPKIEFMPGFTEYKQVKEPSIWKWGDSSWSTFTGKPWAGFSQFLPGFKEAVVAARNTGDHDSHLRGYDDVVARQLQEAMQDDITLSRNVYETDVPVPRGPTVDSELVRELADRVVQPNDGLVDLGVTNLTSSVPLVDNLPFVDAHNGYVDDPVQSLRLAIGHLFPGSVLMQTDQVNGDIHYNDVNITAKVVKLKIDSSKLKHLKPEYVFRPVVPNHVLPNTKQTLVVTLQTVVKRNANTTASAEMLDMELLWERTWQFMKRVYYVSDVDEQLAGMEYIGPTVETVRVWASRLSEQVRRNMDTDFYLNSLQLSSNKLMLKAKRKINLGPTYADTVKPPQSIQYDDTKGRTAVFSPIIAEKVRRDKSVLKSNVFIMQSKSPQDLNNFLANFSWQSDGRGPIHYIEIDGEMFDKSQIIQALMMHWKKCEKFGVLPKYMETLEQGTAFREASSVEAGIKFAMTPQRGSGDSDTLDGNSDVSQAAYARYLDRIRANVEFILIMGDDVTIGVRGNPTIQDVEADTMKEFNLSVKIADNEYGYFVSGFLCHLPGGRITWCTDPVKRALSFGDQSVSQGADFLEKFVSLSDLCRGLSGVATQSYLVKAIAARYGEALAVDYDADQILMLIKCVVTFAAHFKKYRSLFSEQTYKRFL